MAKKLIFNIAYAIARWSCPAGYCLELHQKFHATPDRIDVSTLKYWAEATLYPLNLDAD